MKLILFFNGWSFDHHVVDHLDSSGFYVACTDSYHKHLNNDYFNNLNFDLYDKIYIVAWSFGVAIAYRWWQQTHIKIEKFIALNGTLTPVDNHCGLSVRGCRLTIKNWSLENRAVFNRRIFNDQTSILPDFISNRNIDDQKHELQYLYDAFLEFNYPKDNMITAVVGANDLIFSTKNMLNFWGHNAIMIDKMPHFPFDYFQSWNQIISIG